MGVRETRSLTAVQGSRKDRNRRWLRSVHSDPVLLGTGTGEKEISQSPRVTRESTISSTHADEVLSVSIGLS
jgi:hypothetical protein